MNLLAIDTSLGPCSVAVWRENALVAERTDTISGQQSRVLIGMIESALAEAKLSYETCDAIACTLGPGGFTGIRTGLATARAITCVTGKPMIGISTLETIAYASNKNGDILAVIDAYRGQFYVQRFRHYDTIVAQSPPMLVEAASLNALAHGATLMQETPKARFLGVAAFAAWNKGERSFPHDPVYIREPDAKLPATPPPQILAY